MPHHNRFRHQVYSDPPQGDAIECFTASCSSPDEAQWNSRMGSCGRQWREAGVAAIYLVHGTFVGGDALGLLGEIARLAPDTGRKLRQYQRRAWEWVTNDAGNYTAEFAQRLDAGINAAGETPIPVVNFAWSSENNHIGRADGAIRLLDDLSRRDLPQGSRVLLWAHSHGGNLLALVTNLLANDWRTNSRFFQAARPFYRWPFWGRLDVPIWENVCRLLQASDRSPRRFLFRRSDPDSRKLNERADRLRQLQLDLVTFGAPVRYGWDCDGFARLVHFVHHRPQEATPNWKAAFPDSLDDVMHAEGGDYVHQLGVAGTNIAPPIWSWRSWVADIRLGRILQNRIRRRDLWERLQLGVRVHEDGLNLLVDYGPSVGHIGQHLAGHAVYTRLPWMLFHAEEVSRRLYASRSPGFS